MGSDEKIDPIRKTTDEARHLAHQLMRDAKFASLAVLEPDSGLPLVSRVSVGLDDDGAPIILASDLSGHSKALSVDGRASMMFGEPGKKGDPLTYPRITVIGLLSKLSRDEDGHQLRRKYWLESNPKSKLYIDFGDFHFWKMTVQRANLNGGFGKAFVLTPADLQPL